MQMDAEAFDLMQRLTLALEPLFYERESFVRMGEAGDEEQMRPVHLITVAHARAAHEAFINGKRTVARYAAETGAAPCGDGKHFSLYHKPAFRHFGDRPFKGSPTPDTPTAA